MARQGGKCEMRFVATIAIGSPDLLVAFPARMALDRCAVVRRAEDRVTGVAHAEQPFRSLLANLVLLGASN